MVTDLDRQVQFMVDLIESLMHTSFLQLNPYLFSFTMLASCDDLKSERNLMTANCPFLSPFHYLSNNSIDNDSMCIQIVQNSILNDNLMTKSSCCATSKFLGSSCNVISDVFPIALNSNVAHYHCTDIFRLRGGTNRYFHIDMHGSQNVEIITFEPDSRLLLIDTQYFHRCSLKQFAFLSQLKLFLLPVSMKQRLMKLHLNHLHN
jgi:hypothetical protein